VSASNEPDIYRRYQTRSLGVSALSVGVIALYVVTLLRLPPEHVRGFLFYVLPVAFALLWFASSFDMKRLFDPVTLRVAALRADGLSDEDACDGFRAASNLPRTGFLRGILWWLLGAAFVSGAMKGLFETFSWFSAFILLTAGFTGGLVSMTFNFYRMKSDLEEARELLADRVGDPDVRSGLVHRIPLAQKLLVSLAGVMVVSLLFAALLAQVRASHAVEALSNQINARILDEAADRLVASGFDAADRIDPALGIRLVMLDASGNAVVAGPPDALLAGELNAIRDTGIEMGSSDSFDSPNAFAWRRAGAGVLVAVADRGRLGAAVSGIWLELGVFALVAVFFAIAIARFAARDIENVTRPLAAEVARISGGDLTPGRMLESEDELGDLARGIERMRTSLRETVAGVVTATGGVEETVSSLSSVSHDLNEAASQQAAGLGQVTESMGRIQAEVNGIAESAHGLSMSVEESSSSVLELGVTGEQLNQNAAALNERVSEVSTSIEQMMQSGREVLTAIEDLGGASADTSSSMEEMAASMREVDTNAAETARLSEDVVGIADRGRQKVDQTIQGMQAIQDATDVAHRVIHGLGTRAEEIGQILNVIDDVADETNLLALNAAIIAAQAGEHGRAFSVVADEIKDLAEKVMASTKDIGGLIRGVQEEASNAVGAIERGARSVESGVNLSAEAGVALEEITSAARESGQRITEIVAGVREQSRAAAHVVSLMDQVRDGAEQIRRAGGEQASGNEVVLRNASAMSEVSQQVGGATGEQSQGAYRMREAIENVRGAVEQINSSLRQQSNACDQIATLLEGVAGRTITNEEAAGRMRDATSGLLEHAEGLRDSVRRFQI
jgi:methyl-accepting chemotaxis protein